MATRMQVGRSTARFRGSISCSALRREPMQGVKIGWGGRSFLMTASVDGTGNQKDGKRRKKEERRIMVESFVQKYQSANRGKFPHFSYTCKEVGGSYYIIREIMQEMIYKHKALENLDRAVFSGKQTEVHDLKPVSVSAEMSIPMSKTADEDVGKNIVVGEDQSKEFFDEPAVVSSESAVHCYSSLGKKGDPELCGAEEEETDLSDIKKTSPFTGSKLDCDSVGKQNAERNLDDREVAVSDDWKVTESSCPSAESLNSLGNSEEKQTHSNSQTSQLADLTYVSRSTYSESHVMDNRTSLPNHTELIEEESIKLSASSTSLPMETGHINAGEVANYQGNMFKDQQLPSVSVDKEQELMEFEIQTPDFSQNVSIESQSGSSKNRTPSIGIEDSNNKPRHATPFSVPERSRGEKLGYSYNRESTGDDYNPVKLEGDTDGTHRASENFKGLESSQPWQEKTIWDNIKAFSKEIFSFWKKT